MEYDFSNYSLNNRHYGGSEKKIGIIIDGIDSISEIHKDFYKTMIKERYEKILKYSYMKLKEK